MRRLTNMTMSGFTEYQKEEALAARMRAAIESRTRVSEAEARLAFGDKNEKAKVNYLKLEEPFVRAHIVDGDGAAIKAWMDENAETIEEAWGSAKERYTGCRKARHILVRVDRAAEDQEEAKKAAKKTIEAARKKIAGARPLERLPPT